MDGLDKFLADVKRLEKSLFGLILSSFLFSLIAVLAQPPSTSIQFKALTELVAGIMGTAGVLSVYLSGLHHPKDDYSYLLDFQPFALGARAVLALMFALLMFYLFYRFVGNRTDEICFVFLGLGMFIFFRTIAGSAQTIGRAEQQRAVWWSLPEERRGKWFEQRNALENLHESMQSTIEEAKRISKESKEHRRQYKRDSRRQKWQARLNAISKGWMNLRLKLGGTRLLTTEERTKLEFDELKANKAVEALFSDFHRENVLQIRSGKVRPQRLEGMTNVDVFNLKGVQYYFFLPSNTALETAQRFFEFVPTLKRLTGLDNIEVLAVVPADGTLSIEARSELSKYGIGIVEETPTTSVPPTASS